MCAPAAIVSLSLSFSAFSPEIRQRARFAPQLAHCCCCFGGANKTINRVREPKLASAAALDAKAGEEKEKKEEEKGFE